MNTCLAEEQATDDSRHDDRTRKNKIALVIHGGCGIERADLSADEEALARKALTHALESGYEVLKNGGTALDAVEAAIKSMENSKQFNAGAGAAFDHDGHNTLDAAIMDGSTRQAGAVASVTVVKNPISAARAVMLRTKHVLLVGEGANQFARENGLEIVSPDYFYTKRQWDKLQKFLQNEKASQKTEELKQQKSVGDKGHSSHHFGTVGAVALDSHGNLAAGTSTGGLTGKRWGRVGDSPIIGAGTFADNESCAVSCTGEGEWFIRYGIASDIAAHMKYLHETVQEAGDQVIHALLKKHGEGADIVLDRKGNFAMPYNTEGMFRGYITDGVPHTFIFENSSSAAFETPARSK